MSASKDPTREEAFNHPSRHVVLSEDEMREVKEKRREKEQQRDEQKRREAEGGLLDGNEG